MSTTSVQSSAFAVAVSAADQAHKQLLIGGEWQEAEGSRRFAVQDPATREQIATVADASPADGLRALDAAVAAGPGWASTPANERAAVLRGAAERMRKRAPEIAALMTFEMGKPVAESMGEVNYAADFFDWFAEEAVRAGGSLGMSPNGAWDISVIRQPVGPCVLVTPWNFPAAMPARKLAPALAAGCSAVLKPADLTPLCALVVAEILIESGLPDGVVNVVPTTDAGALVGPLLSDARTRKLSFTGSTPVGKLLMAQAAENVLRISLELGGNAPFIVCADADLDAAVEGAVLAKMRNNGEACTAANRIYVEAAVVEPFTDRLVEKLCAMPIGHGLDDGVQIGPLIDERGLAKAQRVIEQAVADGAERVTGQLPDTELAGSFCPATVLRGVPADSRALEEEVFAPVASVVTVANPGEALARANDNPFGLVSYVYTADLERARWFSRNLESGMVGVNTGLVSNVAAPFGGVKWSGIGREGSEAGIEEYLELKYSAIA